jgi:hypothetical protein
MTLAEIVIGVGFILGGIAVIVALDFLAVDVVQSIAGWIRSHLKKKRSRR